MSLRRQVDVGVGAAALLLLVLSPIFLSSFWVSFILTQTLWYGIAASSLIFLSAYGGMVSLAQTALYGIAGFTLGNVVANSSKGLNLGWNPWIGVVLGIVIATAAGLVFGALSSRSTGIYFLMITLVFAVIANYFFGQVTTFSGFGGISGIRTPSIIGSVEAHPNRLFYVALVVSLAVYLLIRWVLRTPFGLTLQGVRDEPVRMASLGYRVALHRTLAFGFAAFVASLAGVLFVWWNGHIDPASIDLSSTIDLLVIAVIGGLGRVGGAWIGAFAFVVINNYTHTWAIPGIGGSFHTVIGLIFLVIVLASPGGLLGIWDWVWRVGTRRLAVAPGPPAVGERA